ncbi:MAG: M20/M25/M40 family metallo-hydrolase [Ruminococcaceae bacterium]|jgi:acetylornithine deacetylase/succinyl-diaminopimelate desuccinylase-like protein|nr:M20/M25/M40 family metallo-hydrolase [Oscillospiraceae bacterium]
MVKPLSDHAKQYLADHEQFIKDLLFEMCGIPAPSNHEELRAEFIKKWLEDKGAEGVYIDPALNVVFPYQCEGKNDLLVIMAHTDTVFPDMTPFTVKVDGNVAACPGIGDDTTNVAILLTLIKYVLENKLTAPKGVLFVLNAGEEGLGNLKGSRQIVKDFGDRIGEFVSLDGSYTGICNEAVGSMRYKVELTTEGGHSYGAFGNRNAIQRLAAVIEKLYKIEVPHDGNSKTTYNVGMISGGTSVNTIAQQVEMLYEYRSDSRKCLQQMGEWFNEIIDEARKDCIAINVTVLGERPCTGDVDKARQDALLQRAKDAIATAYDGEVRTYPGSTDCNIPLSLGIPAVCFGGYIGKGAHTREEHIFLDSLPVGTEIVAAFLLDYFA